MIQDDGGFIRNETRGEYTGPEFWCDVHDEHPADVEGHCDCPDCEDYREACDETDRADREMESAMYADHDD